MAFHRQPSSVLPLPLLPGAAAALELMATARTAALAGLKAHWLLHEPAKPATRAEARAGDGAREQQSVAFQKGAGRLASSSGQESSRAGWTRVALRNGKKAGTGVSVQLGPAAGPGGRGALPQRRRCTCAGLTSM